ncbi:putative DNA mismatch repair protein [Taphrina deformans PYCC 5710]|uniref:DNA mismatch repair protein n=1 Tax=Taphrina deformans (strain PYCC 5710 / ATCC 11124 / CBS 356.35 / IMI 108563 / JCM 9778 / NBRC 8474) TaxID=1097556 RepID=R4X824_TAPDE|nr:putative DNA mismatch repair protein [Taphrina deformans PYCC 5710]|eukprot:CCG81604.1 putative DNA mismatch repair protein [Taphrina deformans PYCC 5710]
MGISKLSASDARLLNSGQVITDVHSIIKELLENALDASAKSIIVTLEGHGLGQIVVRDDGVGIPEVDRGSLALMGNTSKLSTFADLAVVRSYGFRGQALASLVQIAQKLTVTTRTHTDTVAAVYESTKHQYLQRLKTSADPRGTTVAVVKPWYQLPVRREAFKKQIRGLSPKLKFLVDSYSFIWPTVRFQLILKADKKGDASTIHTRLPQTSLINSVKAVYGPTLMQKYQTFKHEYRGYTMTGLLPQPEASNSPLAAKARLYVDNRLMTCVCDTPKLISTLMKQSILHFCPLMDKDPFWILNIACPLSSYDPNVEPAKDNVFFEQEETVLHAIQSLLNIAYGDSLSPRTLSKTKENGYVSDRVGGALDYGERFPAGTSLSQDCEPCTATDMDNSEDQSTTITTRSDTHNSLNNSLPSLLHGSPLRYQHEPVSVGVSSAVTASQRAVVKTNASLAVATADTDGWSFSMFDDGCHDSSDTGSANDAIVAAVAPSKRKPAMHEMARDIGPEASSEENVVDYVSDRPILINPWSIARMIQKRPLPASTNSGLSSNTNSKDLATGPIEIESTSESEATPTIEAHRTGPTSAPATCSASASAIKPNSDSCKGLSLFQAKNSRTRVLGPARVKENNTSAKSTRDDVACGQSRITKFISGALSSTRGPEDSEMDRTRKRAKVYHTYDFASDAYAHTDVADLARDMSSRQQLRQPIPVGLSSIEKQSAETNNILKLESTAREDMVHNLSRDMVIDSTEVLSGEKTVIYPTDFPMVEREEWNHGIVMATKYLKTFPGELSLWTLCGASGLSLYVAKRADGPESANGVLSSVQGDQEKISTVRIW